MHTEKTTDANKQRKTNAKFITVTRMIGEINQPRTEQDSKRRTREEHVNRECKAYSFYPNTTGRAGREEGESRRQKLRSGLGTDSNAGNRNLYH